jgi:hypothetical protein
MVGLIYSHLGDTEHTEIFQLYPVRNQIQLSDDDGNAPEKNKINIILSQRPLRLCGELLTASNRSKHNRAKEQK